MAQQRFTKSSTGVSPVLVVEFTDETVEAVVTPGLEGVYQWIWLNNGAVSAPAARLTNISWAGGGAEAGLVISFHPTGAAWASFGSDTIHRCIYANDPESEDDDEDGVLDLYDTDGVSGDDDFIKIYPFSPISLLHVFSEQTILNTCPNKIIIYLLYRCAKHLIIFCAEDGR